MISVSLDEHIFIIDLLIYIVFCVEVNLENAQVHGHPETHVLGGLRLEFTSGTGHVSDLCGVSYRCVHTGASTHIILI